MATAAVDRLQLDDEIAPAETAAAAGAPSVQRRRGWIKRMVYSRVAEKQGTATDADDGATARTTKPRRGGWLRRLVPERALRRKLGGGGGGAAARLLPGGLPRWKRVSSIGGGWASALLDAAAFRVMYVVEAVVLGLALSCFFCCCGCQI